MSYFERVAAMAINAQAIGGVRCLTMPATQVELVTGPPGSGKSTLVRERMRPGDAVVDLDLIGEAIAGGQKSSALLPAAWCARDAAMWALATECTPARVWVVACAPTRRERLQAIVPFAGARLTVLEVSAAECMSRINGRAHYADFMGEMREQVVDLITGRVRCRESSTDWRALVEGWWAAYRPAGADEGWTGVEVIG